MSLLHNDGCNYWSSSSGQSYFYCINWRFPPSYLVVGIWNAFPWCKTCLWTFHAFHFKCTPTVRKAGTCTKYLDERVCGSNGIIYDNHGSSPWREWHTMCRNLQAFICPSAVLLNHLCFQQLQPSILHAGALWWIWYVIGGDTGCYTSTSPATAYICLRECLYICVYKGHEFSLLYLMLGAVKWSEGMVSVCKDPAEVCCLSLNKSYFSYYISLIHPNVPHF